MTKYSIFNLVSAALMVLCTAVACQNPESEYTISGSVTTVSAAFGSTDTKVSMEESSLSLVSRWTPGDKFDIYANGDLLIRNVQAGDFSEDWKSCAFGVDIPEDKYPGKVELVCATTNCNATYIDGKLFYNASLVRAPLSNYHPPVVGRGMVTDRTKVTVNFKHYLTYEIVHILNTSGKEIYFSLNGFSAETTWFKSKGAVAEDGTFLVDTKATEDPIFKSSSIQIPASGSGVIVSAYIPNGYLIENARMVAEIDGQEVRSVNTKSSKVELQTGHAYHMYACWDGEELKFVDSNSTGGDLEVDPVVNFGNVIVGQSEYKYLIIKNNSNEEQAVRIALEGKYFGYPFDLPYAEAGDDFVNKIIPAGESRSVAVSFRTTITGEYIGTLTVTSTAIPDGIMTVRLTANGVEEDTSFHLSNNDIEVYINRDAVVHIKNGSGDYDVVNENPDIVDSDINGIHVARTVATKAPTESGQPISDDLWWITAKKLGDATLHLTDKSTNETLTLKVKVIHAPALSIEKDYVELSVGEQEMIEILSGSGSYSVSIDNTNILSAYTSSIGTSGSGGLYGDDMPHNGTYLTINALSAGQTTVTLKDMSSYEEKEVIVYVSGEVAIPDAVDLGLPSGIKWASFNLGATSPEEYGNYYAWGETEPKDDYSWFTYKWAVQKGYGDWDYYFRMTKYCYKPSDGWNDYTDDKVVLDHEDDAAYINLGGYWRMPTTWEFNELVNNCEKKWVTVNGISGCRLTSRINGESVFFPACAYSGRPQDIGLAGYCWSSILRAQGFGSVLPTSKMAFSFYCYYEEADKDDVYIYNNSVDYRNCGLAIRPVYDYFCGLQNGDFEKGKEGFASDYNYISETGIDALGFGGYYAIGSNPRDYNEGFISHGDHTSGSGKMLIVSGSPLRELLWYRSVNVKKGKDYEFNAWVLSINENGVFDKSQIEYLFDGATTVYNGDSHVGVYDMTENGWVRYHLIYHSTADKTITIRIRTNQSGWEGNDFALDDVSFKMISYINDNEPQDAPWSEPDGNGGSQPGQDGGGGEVGGPEGGLD